MYAPRIWNEFEIAAVSLAVGFPLAVLHRRRGRSERADVGKRIGLQTARANLEIEKGRVKSKRVKLGENWQPYLHVLRRQDSETRRIFEAAECGSDRYRWSRRYSMTVLGSVVCPYVRRGP